MRDLNPEEPLQVKQLVQIIENNEKGRKTHWSDHEDLKRLLFAIQTVTHHKSKQLRGDWGQE